jgi:hypothetical protein
MSSFKCLDCEKGCLIIPPFEAWPLVCPYDGVECAWFLLEDPEEVDDPYNRREGYYTG